MSRSTREPPSGSLGAAEIRALVAGLRGPGAEVVDFALRPLSGEALGYLGLHELLSVEVRDGDQPAACRRLTFFVKSVLPTPNGFDLMVFREEAKFFRDARPRMLEGFRGEAWSAECYLVTGESIVLEDLGAAGFETPEGQFTMSQLEAAVACTARFHASSLLLESRVGKPLRQLYPDNFKEKTFTSEPLYEWKWLLAGVEVAECIAAGMGLNPKYVMPAYELQLETSRMVAGERNVLCHGDLWSKNVMFDGAGRCRFVDFQMVTYTTYAMDLLQVIHLNTDRSTRDRSKGDLIRLYHSVLGKNLRDCGYGGDEVVTLEEVLRDVETKKIIGLVTPVQYLPIALLNKNLNAEYTRDNEKLQEYMYSSRKDFVLRAMQLDGFYRRRLEESVRELIEYMQLREENSS